MSSNMIWYLVKKMVVVRSLKNKPFNGDENSVENFIYRLEAAFGQYLTEKEKLQTAANYMTDSALIWYRSNYKPNLCHKHKGAKATINMSSNMIWYLVY